MLYTCNSSHKSLKFLLKCWSVIKMTSTKEMKSRLKRKSGILTISSLTSKRQLYDVKQTGLSKPILSKMKGLFCKKNTQKNGDSKICKVFQNVDCCMTSIAKEKDFIFQDCWLTSIEKGRIIVLLLRYSTEYPKRANE